MYFEFYYVRCLINALSDMGDKQGMIMTRLITT